MNAVRTRFAPSPTGIMHIGNVRAALMNYLFAQQHQGTFILRIEDTDQQRNITDGTTFIVQHLAWLGLTPQEGPQTGGPCAPYFQSKRASLYQQYLQKLQQQQLAYPCFCTPEELEMRRNRQIAMKKAPRYEGTCTKLTEIQISEKIDAKTPFIWRMKVNANQKVSFKDMARGVLTFDLQHFSDFPLTREDGTFTFIFANCVDDCEMKISHVFRGEEHLSNTVSQTVLYQAFQHELPVFWHLPILFNQEGKKLSKRDKGFSLDDVQQQGYLPEAMCNYLGTLGASFQQEIMSLQELAQTYNFDHINPSSQIKYDTEKLKWINHKWIASYDLTKLAQLCKPFLAKEYNLENLSDQTLTILIKSIQTDMQTLTQAPQLLKFYFVRPTIDLQAYADIADSQTFTTIKTILSKNSIHDQWEPFIAKVKEDSRAANIADKTLFCAIRIFMTGHPKGMQLQDLFMCLGSKEFFNRCK